MKYPEWLFGDNTDFTKLPETYQEWFNRWYSYDNNDNAQCEKLTPKLIKKIEKYMVEHLNAIHLFCAKGFTSARNIDSEDNDNIAFKSDSEFRCVCLYVARLCFRDGVKNAWFKKDVSKEEFLEHCNALKFHYEKIHI